MLISLHNSDLGWESALSTCQISQWSNDSGGFLLISSFAKIVNRNFISHMVLQKVIKSDFDVSVVTVNNAWSAGHIITIRRI